MSSGYLEYFRFSETKTTLKPFISLCSAAIVELAIVAQNNCVTPLKWLLAVDLSQDQLSTF